MPKYALEVTSEAYELCVFLNDGHILEIRDLTFLVFEINSPREITSKVVTADEMKSDAYKDVIFLKA